jgi:hypothetical protein
MLKHLANISDYEVQYVTENDFYSKKDAIEEYVEMFLDQKIKFGV